MGHGEVFPLPESFLGNTILPLSRGVSTKVILSLNSTNWNKAFIGQTADIGKRSKDGTWVELVTRWPRSGNTLF